MNRTIIVRRNYLHFIKKYQRYWFPFILWSPFFICTLRNIIYNSFFFFFLTPLFRYEKRHSNIPAHVSPCFRVKEGDHVIIGQCRWDFTGEFFLFFSVEDTVISLYYYYIDVGNYVFLNYLYLCNFFRPLSKTVRFNVLKVIPAGSSSGAGKKAFTGMWDLNDFRSIEILSSMLKVILISVWWNSDQFWFAFEVMYCDWIRSSLLCFFFGHNVMMVTKY